MLWSDTPIETWPKSETPYNYNPYQKEIEFFWPLTEQIELELDYSGCNTNNCTISTSNSTIAISNGGTWMTSPISISENKMEVNVGIDTPGLTMQLKEKPNFVKRYLYKLLGINWRIV